MSTQNASRRAALDAQYNLRAAVPEHSQFFARYRERSASTHARHGVLPDRRYGSGTRQAIDLFPAGAQGAPLYVFIHGGYWQAMDRKDFAFMAEPFLAAGWAAAVVGYDLAPEVTLPAIVEEIRAALAWLHRRAAAFGADPDRIALAGHSAGGHLGAMALATDWPARGLPADLVKATCLISGVFDLEPVRRCYLNDVLGLGPADARCCSPVHRPPQARLPVVLTLGALETQAFHDQSARYAEVLEAAGLAAELLVQPELHHFSILEAMADPANPATARLLAALPAGGPIG